MPQRGRCAVSRHSATSLPTSQALRFTTVVFLTPYSNCIIATMPSTRRRPQSTQSPRQTADGRGSTPRFITSTDVDRAADTLLRDGERPTIEKVRQKIGRGSPNTINPLLDQWWSRLAGRLDAGPAALHRLPEPVLHAAEGLWLQCLDEARRRARTEDQSSRKVAAQERRDLELRSHILSIREAELTKRIEAAEQRAARLELEVETLTTLLRKEQASRLAAERRVRKPGDRRAAASPRKRSSKPLPKSPRTGVARKRTATTRRQPRQ
jgi:hypothetical protein